jgi:hypothetical protein
MSLSSYEYKTGDDSFFQEMLFFISDVLFAKTLPNPDPNGFPNPDPETNPDDLVSLFQMLMRSQTVSVAGNSTPLDELNLSGMTVFTQAGACAPFCSPSVDPDKWYWRGAGHCQCEGDYSDWGLLCRHNSAWWGLEECHDCHKEEEKYAGGVLCYPKCKPGYSVSSVSTCSQNDKICGAAALGARLGRVSGLSNLELVIDPVTNKPQATIIVQDNNFIITLDATLPSVTYKGADSDIYGTARPFTVPCDENWEDHLPRDIVFGVGTQTLTNIRASINITVPFTVNDEFLNKTLTLHFENSNMTFTGLNANFLQIALGSVLPDIFPDIFSYANGKIGGLIQGLIPTNLLSYLPDEYKNYVLHLLFTPDNTDPTKPKTVGQSVTTENKPKLNELIDILNSKQSYWWSTKNYTLKSTTYVPTEENPLGLNPNGRGLLDTTKKDTRDIQKNVKKNRPTGIPPANYQLGKENAPLTRIPIEAFVNKPNILESFSYTNSSSDVYTSLSKSYTR